MPVARALLLTCLLTTSACVQVLGYSEPSLDDEPGTGEDAGVTPNPFPDAGDNPPLFPDGGPGPGQNACARVPTFGAPTNYGVGNEPRALATGDFDHDLIMDIVVIHGQSSFVTILHGTITGTLTRSQNVNLPVGCAMGNSIAGGDLNKDGYDDIVLTASGQSCGGTYLLRQDKANPGQFLAATLITSSPTTGELVVAEVSGDTFNDLVFAGFDGVRRFYQKSAAPGTFTEQTLMTFGGPILKANPIVMDFDDDGRNDIAIAANDRANVAFQSPSTPGTYGAPVAVGPTGVFTLAGGDVNGDSLADFVVSTMMLTAVLTQDPMMPGTFLVGQTDSMTILSDIRLVDVNADSRVDMVEPSGQVRWQCAAPAPPGTFDSQTSNFGQMGQTAYLQLDGDGRADAVVLDASMDRVTVLLQNQF